MEKVYFIQEAATGTWLCHGKPPSGFPKEGDYYLEQHTMKASGIYAPPFVCSFDPNETLDHIKEAAKLTLLRWYPGDKKK